MRFGERLFQKYFMDFTRAVGMPDCASWSAKYRARGLKIPSPLMTQAYRFVVLFLCGCIVKSIAHSQKGKRS